ncbi:hypothetical protein N7478_003791 [Penicillium angulare]|uniref:uncharacterized protein n=1 Tax=Penicillium angulare TaxID=116970 RepID=UPI0025401F66|nr:uncharacterized protein N7478_003791 [Penicillium angulare]KAJ5288105.1 hypothetical protein N7478_003791 [Penicillium angulare]
MPMVVPLPCGDSDSLDIFPSWKTVAWRWEIASPTSIVTPLANRMALVALNPSSTACKAAAAASFVPLSFQSRLAGVRPLSHVLMIKVGFFGDGDMPEL